MGSECQSQQLEDEDRLSTLTNYNCSMEAKNDKNSSQSHSQGEQPDEEDRLSALTDDILLSILGRLSSRMAARTSVLSTRWMNLTWLLPEISINAKEFLYAPCPHPIYTNYMEKLAMVSLTNATRNFLGGHQREISYGHHLKSAP